MKKQLKVLATKFVKDESAQGATEYILLLVAVVAMVVIFKNQIKEKMEGLLGKLSEQIDGFSNQ
jgi:Flp pilus assembly pilin Flp